MKTLHKLLLAVLLTSALALTSCTWGDEKDSSSDTSDTTSVADSSSAVATTTSATTTSTTSATTTATTVATTTTPATTTTTATTVATTTTPATTTTRATTVATTTTPATTTTRATTVATTTTPATTTTTATTSATPEETTFYSEVARLVNIEREKAGINPIIIDFDLQKIAQLRATEIVTLFSHTRPDGRDCFSAVSDAGYSFRTVGENIACGQRTPADVVTAWMDSEGHRANILNGDFTKMGIGYIYTSGDIYGHYWVQMFAG